MGGTIQAFVKLVPSLLRPFVDFIFPAVCLSCFRLLTEREKHICESCWKSIPRISSRHPLFCETKDKLLDSQLVDGLISVFLFEKQGVFQNLAHALKYDGFESIGRMLGRELGRAIHSARFPGDILIPIPLHEAKFRERGFNQAEAIARGVSDITGLEVGTDLVFRRIATKTQTKLSVSERRDNMEGAFETARKQRSLLWGRACIVIDDVITTGATIVSCAKTLHEAGASRIVAASAALAE